MEFGKRIFEIRNNAKLTQAQFAELFDVSQQAVQKWESGVSAPDIDKIINKSSRKRILSFDITKVTRLEKYNPAFISNIDNKQIVFACNTDDSEIYFMAAEDAKGKTVYLVFAPDKRIKSAIKKFAPRFITNSIFE